MAEQFSFDSLSSSQRRRHAPRSIVFAAVVATAFGCPAMAGDQTEFEPPFAPPVCDSPCVKTPTPPNCNPVYILEQYASQKLKGFVAENLPDFDRYRRQIYIVDKGDKWDVTYIPAIDAPPEQTLDLGGGFPVLVISKAECKVVKVEFYQ